MLGQGTLLMAMAHGMAVVSTPTHHALELLYDSAGLLIPYAHPNGTALAEALNALLSSASLRAAMVSGHLRGTPTYLKSLSTPM